MEAAGRAEPAAAAWIVCSPAQRVERVQATRAGQSFLATHGRQPRSFFGMHLAHLGIAVFIVGVTMVGAYQTEKDVKMDIGDTVSVGGYASASTACASSRGRTTARWSATSICSRTAARGAQDVPEKRFYVASSMPMTEAAIDTGFLRDVYVSLGEPIDKARPDAAWAVRVYHKPFVDWIWGGCVLMASADCWP
jgi:cytochrome c-type biogenesis protein CcmF